MASSKGASAAHEKHRKRGSRLWLLPLLFLLMIPCLYLGVRHFKPDWIFLAEEQIAGITRHANLTEIPKNKLSIEKISLTDICNQPDTYTADSSLLLVNDTHMLSEDYTPDLTDYEDTDVEMNPSLEDPYRNLAAEIKDRFDTPLYIRSSYRSAAQQKAESEAEPALAAAVGASEHETGLALDVYVPRFAGSGFIKSGAGRYVNRYCWQYGFIIRYPCGKESVTGIPYEPWHLRYVGKPHAEIIYKASLTLEEYLESLVPGACYEYGGYLITRQAPENGTLSIPEGLQDIHISPDNEGHYVICGIMAD